MSEQATEQKSATDDTKKEPALLGCLVFLTAHYGRAKSARALVAGLPYNGHDMGVELFCQAARRLSIKTKVAKYKTINAIKPAVLPAVIILEDEKACVLVKINQKSAQIFDPETEQLQTLPREELENRYAGYAVLVQPKPEFTNPDINDEDDSEGHWFWSLAEQNRGIYGMVLLGAVFINLFGLTSPLFIMNVYDRVIPNGAIETGWALAIGALTVFVFDFIMRTLRAYLIDLAGRRMDVMATRRIYDQVLDMRLSERPKSSGAFASMLKDFDTVRDFFTSATITGLVDLPFTIFFLFIIYKLGGAIALVLLGLIMLVTFIGLILQVPLKKLVRKAARSSEAKHGLLVETIHGLETVKAIGADGAFRARYGAVVGENAAYGQSSRLVSGLGMNFATFFQQIATILVVLVGMYLVRDNMLTVGGLIACVLLSSRALAPIGQIANLMVRYHQAGGALKTLDKIMNKPVERPKGKSFLHRPDLKGKIAFQNVSFSYPDIKRDVLKDVTLTIQPGEKVAIIGRIGSGKSTIARLMMGLYEANSGTILADDTDYRQIDPADLRSAYAYIAQDVVLFNGTVRDNITASKPDASEEEILSAAKASGVHDFISRHPMGYDAPVGESGDGLSGGQRQAVALARAMLTKPKVLICDEPTNAMDMHAESAFRNYVEQEIKDKTFVLVTHKNAMLTMVERIIVVDQGRVMMDGPRDKVLEALSGAGVRKEGGGA